MAFTRDAIRINNHVIPLSGMDQIGWALRNPLAGCPHAWIRLTSDWQLVVAPPGDNAARGRQVADALLTLRDAATPGALARADAAFADVVARYRQAEPKPEPDEDMRRAEVQAEGAVREKNFYDADTLYDTALAAAPWWPQGHFNRALILESEEDYAGAVTEMQCYLALVPFASNARAAQDKIYQWQAHLHAENSR